MNIRSLSLLVCAVLSMNSGLLADVVGYDRLYHPGTNKIIDLLHDDHVNERKLSNRDMRRKPCSYIEKKLFRTEKRFIKALRTLNEKAPGTVDVVWEHGIYKDADREFIGFSHRLVKGQFPNINWIASDISRDAFEELLYADGRRSLGKKFRGVSMNNPMPISDATMAAILTYSGDHAWAEYKKLHTKTVNRLKARFKRDYLNDVDFRERDFKGTKPFDALADLEMLAHILASNKPHVILYAGGWHADHIADFLSKKLGYTFLKEEYNRGDEISVSVLNLIDSACTDSSQGSHVVSNQPVAGGYESDYEDDYGDYEYICEDCGRPLSDQY